MIPCKRTWCKIVKRVKIALDFLSTKCSCCVLGSCAYSLNLIPFSYFVVLSSRACSTECVLLYEKIHFLCSSLSLLFFIYPVLVLPLNRFTWIKHEDATARSCWDEGGVKKRGRNGKWRDVLKIMILCVKELLFVMHRIKDFFSEAKKNYLTELEIGQGNAMGSCCARDKEERSHIWKSPPKIHLFVTILSCDINVSILVANSEILTNYAIEGDMRRRRKNDNDSVLGSVYK